MSSLLQFHLFPALPVELRLKTWKYLLPPPRNLPVSYNSRTGRYETTHASKRNLQLLHTCAESRSLFLETYTLLTLNPSHASTIYINFNVDTLFFHDLECSPTGDLGHDFAMSPDKDKIQHIAIDSCLWEVLRAFKFESLAEIGQLGGLKSVALVMVHETNRIDIRDTRTPSFWSVRELESWREEVRHVSLYLEQLRTDMEARPEGSWRTGRPTVTMWLC